VSGSGVTLHRVDALPTDVTRTWLGPQYWSNRLVDWRLANGRIESLTGGRRSGRTVAVLTRNVATGQQPGVVSVRTGTLATGSGFSGFLIGVGAGRLHWKAAALVMGASGQGGGMLAVYDSDGNVRFREHTDEVDQFAYAEFPATARSGPAPARAADEDVVLQLDIIPVGSRRFDLTLTARRFDDATLLSTATRNVAEADIVGGISLFSSPRSASSNARYWFRELQTDGAKISEHPDRDTGPVLGTLYSLNGSVLKLSAQFMPIGASDPRQATLQRRRIGTSSWSDVQTTTIGPGYLALFRVTDWDASKDWEFRVAWAEGSAQQSLYTGTIGRDPKTKARIGIAMVNCTQHAVRQLERASSGVPTLPGERFRGLYTTETLYFPYALMVENIKSHAPDLLVAFGDQYYEGKPTATDRAHPLLDVLSRYYLWLWSFADISRQTPTICLIDDHDVLQANLWGWSGRAAPQGDWRLGGYVLAPTWVNTVQRVQCAHNPDAFDPTPVRRGITVYYGAFSYGGVSFAMLEDRKFKNTNQDGTNPDGTPLKPPRDLLGRRQENFLRAWASMHPGQPKVCLTQTTFACVQTTPTGRPRKDRDSGGAPPAARRTALRLLKAARALMLSGDQHMASLVRHGIDAFADGPMQFTAPAAGSGWQRWFEPDHRLPNSRGPHTGDWTDGFGNRFRVVAVANPKLTFAQVHAVQRGNAVGDRSLKREGYGIVRVDKTARRYRIECWPWRTDPTAAGARQYRGWPFDLSFSDV
jgi:alkaline phosphatase D